MSSPLSRRGFFGATGAFALLPALPAVARSATRDWPPAEGEGHAEALPRHRPRRGREGDAPLQADRHRPRADGRTADPVDRGGPAGARRALPGGRPDGRQPDDRRLPERDLQERPEGTPTSKRSYQSIKPRATSGCRLLNTLGRKTAGPRVTSRSSGRAGRRVDRLRLRADERFAAAAGRRARTRSTRCGPTSPTS